MSSKYNKWERYHNRFNMIFNGIIAVPMIPFAFFFLETQKEFPDSPLLTGSIAIWVEVILVLVAVIAIAYSQMFRKQIRFAVGQEKSIEEKLDAYLHWNTRQYFILTVATIAAITGLFLMKEQLFSVLYVVVLFIFSLTRPNFDKTVRETGIPESELTEWGKEF